MTRVNEKTEDSVKTLSGGCMCGTVRFTVEDRFSRFYFCHCEQCRKMTGSAHASNLFTSIDNIHWEKGQEETVRYDHPTRSFSRVFCKHCGSGLPYQSRSGKALIVPAGSLDGEPTKLPDAQIFCGEQTEWHKQLHSLKKYDKFPE